MRESSSEMLPERQKQISTVEPLCSMLVFGVVVPSPAVVFPCHRWAHRGLNQRKRERERERERFPGERESWMDYFYSVDI